MIELSRFMVPQPPRTHTASWPIAYRMATAIPIRSPTHGKVTPWSLMCWLATTSGSGTNLAVGAKHCRSQRKAVAWPSPIPSDGN